MHFLIIISYIILTQVVADVGVLRQRTAGMQDTTNLSDSSILWRARIHRFLGLQIRNNSLSMNYDRTWLQSTMFYST